jgi:hypothetical protein
MKYRVERHLIKDNCLGLVDFFDDLESAEAVAKAHSKAFKTYTRIVCDGIKVKEYEYKPKAKKNC